MNKQTNRWTMRLECWKETPLYNMLRTNMLMIDVMLKKSALHTLYFVSARSHTKIDDLELYMLNCWLSWFHFTKKSAKNE